MQLPGPAGLLRTMTLTVRVRPRTLCVIVIVSCARAASTNENLAFAHFFVRQPAVGVRWSADQPNVIGGGIGVGGVGAGVTGAGTGVTGVAGVAGAGTGALTVKVVEAELLPPALLALTVKVYTPTPSPLRAAFSGPKATPRPLSVQSMAVAASPAIVNVMSGEPLTDEDGGTEVSTTVGAVGVTVQLTVAELVPPGPSVTTMNV